MFADPLSKHTIGAPYLAVAYEYSFSKGEQRYFTLALEFY